MPDQLDLFADQPDGIQQAAAPQPEELEWPEQREDEALWAELKGMTMAEQNAKAAAARALPTYGPQRATRSRLPAWSAPHAPNDAKAVAAGKEWSDTDRKRNMATPGLEPPLRSGRPWTMTITKAQCMAARYRNDRYVEELAHLRKHGKMWYT